MDARRSSVRPHRTHTRGPRGVWQTAQQRASQKVEALDEQRARWRSLASKGMETSGAASHTLGRVEKNSGRPAPPSSSGGTSRGPRATEGAGRSVTFASKTIMTTDVAAGKCLDGFHGRRCCFTCKQVSVEGVLNLLLSAAALVWRPWPRSLLGEHHRLIAAYRGLLEEMVDGLCAMDFRHQANRFACSQRHATLRH